MGDRAVFVQQLTGSCKPRQKHNMLLNKQLCEQRAAPGKPARNHRQQEQTCLLRGAARALQNTALPGLRSGVTVLTAGRAALLSLPAAGGADVQV